MSGQSPSAGARANLVALVAAAVLTVLLGTMFLRVVQLQTRPSAALALHMDERATVVTEPGVRGDLVDRRGRLLGASRFGHRVFVDPSRFPCPPDEALARLAQASGIPLDEVARRIVPRLATNQARLAAMESAPRRPTPGTLGALVGMRGDDPGGTGAAAPDAPGSLIRYVSVGGVLEDWRVDLVRGLGIPGVYLELRGVREQVEPALTGSLLGLVGIDHDGLAGAERLFDAVMRPQNGRLRYIRDARSRPMWVEAGGYTAPQRGHDARLALDLELQRIVVEELTRGMEDADAAGGRCVLVDPATGEVLAMADLFRPVPGAVAFDWSNPAPARKPRYRTVRPSEGPLARNRCVEDVYEPGSTFKPFMWSVTTDAGLADPDEPVDTENGSWVTPYGRPVKDVVRKPVMTWGQVLIHSSNIGMCKITRRLTDRQMRDAVLAFGFGSRTGLGIPGESAGIVTAAKAWSKYTQTSVAMGHEIAVTPVQMARAFCAFARTGARAGTIPPLRLTALDTSFPGPGAGADGPRIVSPRIAELTRDTMRGVAMAAERKLAGASADEAPPRYEMFGKSGTAEIPLGAPPKGTRRPRGLKGYYPNQYNSSFVAGAPASRPRLVVLVVIDDPGPARIAARTHYGSHVAYPVARRVMERALAYLGVPPDAPAPDPATSAAADGAPIPAADGRLLVQGPASMSPRTNSR